MPKKMTCRASIRAHRFLGAWFRSPTAGGEYAINSQPTLLRQTLREVAGAFNLQELTFFVAVLQGCHLTPELAGQHLAADIADVLEMEPEGWEDLDVSEDLVNQVERLPIFARAALEIWAQAYSAQPREIDAKEYARRLLESIPKGGPR
jgi:hypothetical protein